MPSLNRVLLIGNLTRDPEIRYTPKGTTLADIGLAINRIWKNDEGEKQEDTTFVDVTLWGKLAEVAEKYLKKGEPVLVEGRLQLDSWDDKQTGQKRSRLRVVAENLQMLGSRAPSAKQANAKSPPENREGSAFRNPAKAQPPTRGEGEHDAETPF